MNTINKKLTTLLKPKRCIVKIKRSNRNTLFDLLTDLAVCSAVNLSRNQRICLKRKLIKYGKNVFSAIRQFN